MSSIKEDINELIQFYIKDFRIKTGGTLIAFMDTKLGGMKLKELKDITEKLLRVQIQKNRKHEVVRAKSFYIRAATEMGYTSREIADVIGVERSNVSHHTTGHSKISSTIGFDEEYMKYKSELLKKINKTEVCD